MYMYMYICILRSEVQEKERCSEYNATCVCTATGVSPLMVLGYLPKAGVPAFMRACWARMVGNMKTRGINLARPRQKAGCNK